MSQTKLKSSKKSSEKLLSPKILTKESINLLSKHRPSSSKVRNIHTLGLLKRQSAKHLKKNSFKRTNYQPNANFDYLDCKDIINIQTLTISSMPKSENITPTYGFHEDFIDSKFRDTPISDLSDESSLYYPNEPKIHFTEKKETFESSKKSLKIKHPSHKILIKKPKIVITNKEFQGNSSKYLTKPLKDISELIFSHNKVKPKGRIRRGLCINASRSPMSRILQNLKLES